MEAIYQSLVAVNPVTLIAQICNLFITLFVFKKFFWSKVLDILDQRRAAADKEITDAQNARQEAMEIKATYEENMRQSKVLFLLPVGVPTVVVLTRLGVLGFYALAYAAAGCDLLLELLIVKLVIHGKRHRLPLPCGKVCGIAEGQLGETLLASGYQGRSVQNGIGEVRKDAVMSVVALVLKFYGLNCHALALGPLAVFALADGELLPNHLFVFDDQLSKGSRDL